MKDQGRKTLFIFEETFNSFRYEDHEISAVITYIHTIEYASHKVFNKNAEKEVGRKFSLNAKYAELAIK